MSLVLTVFDQGLRMLLLSPTFVPTKDKSRTSQLIGLSDWTVEFF